MVRYANRQFSTGNSFRKKISLQIDGELRKGFFAFNCGDIRTCKYNTRLLYVIHIVNEGFA